jgi:hypothetical protein
MGCIFTNVNCWQLPWISLLGVLFLNFKINNNEIVKMCKFSCTWSSLFTSLLFKTTNWLMLGLWKDMNPAQA